MNSDVVRIGSCIRNFYVSDPEGNLIEIGSMNKNI